MRLLDGTAGDSERRFAAHVSDMRKLGRFDTGPSSSEVSLALGILALRWDDVLKRDMIDDVRKFWLSWEHYEAYEEMEKRRSMPKADSAPPDGMTPEQFIELLGMKVVDSGDGYATGGW